jgi:hypothetical protein
MEYLGSFKQRDDDDDNADFANAVVVVVVVLVAATDAEVMIIISSLLLLLLLPAFKVLVPISAGLFVALFKVTVEKGEEACIDNTSNKSRARKPVADVIMMKYDVFHLCEKVCV